MLIRESVSQLNKYYQTIKGIVGQHPIILDPTQFLLRRQPLPPPSDPAGHAEAPAGDGVDEHAGLDTEHAREHDGVSRER